MLDCLIVGGGPAGLLAATYLGRFLRSVRLIDAGQSRAALIPESHNYPGFRGIAGPELLERLREQACRFGVEPEPGEVTEMELQPDGSFIAECGNQHIRVQRVLLATGIVDKAPTIAGLDTGIYSGAIRFCPICDGYEAMDRRIGVLGEPATAATKALFLRTYTRQITACLTTDPAPEAARVLREMSVQFFCDPVRVEHGDNQVLVMFAGGKRLEFDILYPALGCDVRSQLALALGSRKNESGNLQVDEHQRTSVPGLYAAGDVVSDLNQISVALGHATIAASAIHKSLPRNPR